MTNIATENSSSLKDKSSSDKETGVQPADEGNQATDAVDAAEIPEGCFLDPLSDEERMLLRKISEKKPEEVQLLLNKHPSIQINAADEQGMTPLLHAAHLGQYEICRLLLQAGADVNFAGHAHHYSALMFAAIGGYIPVVNLLLEHGASVSHVNSLQRNAAQMAAFVGQYEVVKVINNFLPLSSLEYFTHTHGLETEPKLKKHLLKPLHVLLRRVNIHPVRMLMELIKQPDILEHRKSVATVIELVSDQEMTASIDPNEPLALKLSYLSHLLLYLDRQLQLARKKLPDLPDAELTKHTFETIIKNWIDGRQHKGFPIKLEEFLRNAIREFKYRDCGTFINLVRTLAEVPIGDEPSALAMMCSSINGQKGFSDEAKNCYTCGEVNPPKKCSRCKMVDYCDQECQRLHWSTHKLFCEQLKAEHEKQLKHEAAQKAKSSGQKEEKNGQTDQNGQQKNEDTSDKSITANQLHTEIHNKLSI